MSLADAWGRQEAGRRPHGVSAVLLPYDPDGTMDWESFERHVARTHAAGLAVAVNMDTGFGDLLSAVEREEVLDRTRAVLEPGTRFYAGAFTDDDAGPVPAYHRAVAAIVGRGAVPVIVQCVAMRGLAGDELAALYRRIVEPAPEVIAFELNPVFAAHGAIWDDDTFRRLLDVPGIVGAKHSSLDRALELQRLADRDRHRPDFRLYTGNDLGVDMVAFGSDYLLGLSTFAPEAFAARDAALAAGDLAFIGLNDDLQHLGNVGFRAPVPAYKHAAAQFLHLTGGLPHDGVHPRAARRPGSDRVILLDCAVRLGMVDDVERTWRERVEPWL